MAFFLFCHSFASKHVVCSGQSSSFEGGAAVARGFCGRLSVVVADRPLGIVVVATSGT